MNQKRNEPKRIYIEPPPYERTAMLRVMEAGNDSLVCDAMVSMAFYEPDWRFAQNKFLDLLEHEDSRISTLAATCLGHVARIHKKLDYEKVVSALNQHMTDPGKTGNIEDALDDINWYVSND